MGIKKLFVLASLVSAFALSVPALQAQPPASAKPAVKPAVKAPAKPSPNAELIKLAKAGMGEDILLATVNDAKSKNLKYDTSADALVALKDAGVSQKVISAIFDVSAETNPAPPVPPDPPSPPSPRNAVGEVLLPDGTEVRMRLVQAVSSAKAKVDEKIRFEAAEDVLVNNRVVIAQGAPGVGTVTVAEEKKNFGRRGKLDFTIDTVKTIDGQNIRLRVTKRVEGDEHYVKAGVLTYFTGIGGLFVHGKDVTVDAGTEYTIYIDGERRINLKAVPSK